MFDKGVNIPCILKAVHNPEERKKWDKEITEAEVPRIENNSTVMVWH